MDLDDFCPHWYWFSSFPKFLFQTNIYTRKQWVNEIAIETKIKYFSLVSSCSDIFSIWAKYKINTKIAKFFENYLKQTMLISLWFLNSSCLSWKNKYCHNKRKKINNKKKEKTYLNVRTTSSLRKSVIFNVLSLELDNTKWAESFTISKVRKRKKKRKWWGIPGEQHT